MNVLHTLPVPIIPISPANTDYNRVLVKLEAVFAGNAPLLKVARNHARTEQAVRMAAHGNGIHCVKWTNPDSGRWILVVALKSDYYTLSDLTRILTGTTADILNRHAR